MNNRINCPYCRLADINCICKEIKKCKSKLDIVILQHIRETSKAIGTAKIVNLSISNATIIKGINFKNNKKYIELLEEDRQFYLLYPDEAAISIEDVELDPNKKNTLLVIDGTWSHAFRILKENKLPENLIKIKINPKFASNYRIRTQPNNLCLSTVESVVYTLDSLEKQKGKYKHLLDTFDKMIDRQASYVPEEHKLLKKRFKKVIDAH